MPGLRFSAWLSFAFDNGTAVTTDTYNPEKWFDYDTLFAVTLSQDDGATFSRLQYPACVVSPWSTYDKHEMPRRAFDCLIDCDGFALGD